MKHLRTFLCATMASTCVFFAARMVVGSGGTDVRPLARSLGTATINDCRVTGRVESRTNGVYAVFDFDNLANNDTDVKFNYLASHTAPMSPMSRMGPRPETVKKGMVTVLVKPGKLTEEVLLRETLPVSPDDAMPAVGTGVTARSAMPLSPDIWSLVVSRDEIKGMHGWGAVGPAASDAAISLDKGEAVLASTVLEKQAK